MNLPKTYRSRLVILWVALAMIAALSMPAYADTPTVTASPATLPFTYSTTAQQPLPQSSRISISDGSSIQITGVTQNFTPASPNLPNPFTFQFNGTVLTVGLDPTNLGILVNMKHAADGTYTDDFTVTVTGGFSTVVRATLLLNSPGSFRSSVASLTIPVGLNSTASASFNVNSDTTVTFTSSSSVAWATVSPLTGSVPASTQIPITVTVTSYGYAITPPSGTITITPSTGAPVQVTVIMQIGGTGSGTLSVNPTVLPLSSASGSTGAVTGTFTATNSSAAGYTAYIIPVSGGNWLTFANNGLATTTGTFLTGTAGIVVSANPIGLANGTYTAQVIVISSDQNSQTVQVQFTVGTGASGITASPSYITLSSTVPSQLLTLTSSTAVSFTAASGASSWLGVAPSTGVFSGGTASVTVYYIPGTLSSGTYSSSITITNLSTGVASLVPVTLTVGTGTGTGGSVTGVAPTSLTFSGQAGAGASGAIGVQYIGIAGTSGSFTATATTNNGGSAWLQIDAGSGSLPGQITVSVVPATLAVGTYTGNIAIVANGITTNVPVTLNLTATAALIATDGGLLWNFSQPAPTTRFLYLTASDGITSVSGLTLTPSASWITIASKTNTATPSSVAVTLDPTTLPSGVNYGTITVTGTGAANLPLVIPVVANVIYSSGGTGTGALTLSPSTVPLTAAVGSTTPVTATVQVTAASQVAFTAVPTVTSPANGTWLTVSPLYGTASLTPTAITISANPAGLPAGTYSATVALYATGATAQNVTVTFTVTGAVVTLTPSTLSFNYQAGLAAPAAQTVSITGASGSFTASASSTGNWLAVTPLTGTVPATLSVSIVGSALTTAGVFNGTISVTPAGGVAQTIPVSVTVTAPPTVTAPTTPLSFSYRSGDALPPTQTIQVTATGSSTPLSFSASASTTSGGNWLSVTPSSGSTPSPVSVNVTPGSLDPGTYAGTIAIAGTGGAAGSVSISVTLTVTAPLPTISKVINAASGVSGSVSPGEFVTIFGTAIAGTDTVLASFDASGNLPTVLGGVQVFFNGSAAPLYSIANSSQLTAVVPYSMASSPTVNIQVRFRGNTSNAVSMPVTATMPGIFSQNQSGSGPGVVANGDTNTINGPANPIAKGGTIVIYATGEGIVQNAFGARPATGARVVASTLNDLPRPLLPVAVLIDGKPATVVYAGSIAGLAAGVLQVNAVVPPDVNSGNVSLVLSVGSNSSQSGITVSVK